MGEPPEPRDHVPATFGVALPGFGFLGRTDYKHVYAFVILMLVLIFRPRGILGEQVAEKV